MAQFVSFFSRQLMMGDQSGSGIIYSQVFDVSDANEIIMDFRIHAASGDGVSGVECTAKIEHTNDPSMNDFTTLQTIAQDGSGITGTTVANPKRFIRAELSIPGGAFAMVDLTARANC